MYFTKGTKCLVCGDIGDPITFPPCSCAICLDCSSNWIITQNKDTLQLSEYYGNCANSNCKADIPLDWVFKNFNAKEKNEISEILFKKYSNNADDIKKCPMKECSFVGFQHKKNCNTPYE